MTSHRFVRIGVLALLSLGLATASASQTTDGRERTYSDSATETHVLLDVLVVGYTREFMADERRRKHLVIGRDLERMRQHYHDAVAERLAPEFSIATEPGPRVVRVEAYLVDHELDNRDWLANKDTFRGAPGVRLVAYLRDSRTGEILDRVGMTLGPRPSRLMKNSPGYYWDFMRSAFDRIATRLLWALEDGVAAS